MPLIYFNSIKEVVIGSGWTVLKQINLRNMGVAKWRIYLILLHLGLAMSMDNSHWDSVKPHMKLIRSQYIWSKTITVAIYLAISVKPQDAVAWRGVHPSLSQTSTSALFATRNSTISRLSSIHACERISNIFMMNVVVVLVFYGPSTLFRSYRVRSINLSTLFLGKPPRHFTNI